MRDGWTNVSLGDRLKLELDQVDVLPGLEYPIVGVLNRGRGLLQRESTTSEGTRYQRLNRVLPGRVIYSKLKAFEGAATVTPESLGEAFASSEFPTFRCTDGLIPSYACLLTQRPELWDEMALLSKGIGGRRERLHPRDFLRVHVSLPPVQEQARIVDVIAAVDDAIQAAEQATRSVGRLRQVVRSRHLSDVGTREWRPLGELVESRLGKMLSAPTAGAAPMAPYLRNADVQWGRINTVDLKTMPFSEADRSEFCLRKGDVLVCEGGEIGRSAVLSSDLESVYFQKALHRVRCGPDLHPYFFQLLMEELAFNGTLVLHSGGSTIPHLTGEKLRRIPIPLFAKEEQSELVETMISLTAVHAQNANCEGALRQLRKELLTALLSGAHEIPNSYDEIMGSLSDGRLQRGKQRPSTDLEPAEDGPLEAYPG